MSQITKSNYRVWWQEDHIIENTISELECPETKHFRYWFRGCRWNPYRIKPNVSGGKAISLSLVPGGLDALEELNGSYMHSDTIEQRRIKSLRYILAKAYYRLCCEMIEINCVKKDQHIKAVAFAVGTGGDIYQHLLIRKEIRVHRKYPPKKQPCETDQCETDPVSRFELLDFED